MCSLSRQSIGALAEHTENTSRDATQLVRWHADCCLATNCNIRPIVVCANRGMFIEPLPSSALSRSVTDTVLTKIMPVSSSVALGTLNIFEAFSKPDCFNCLHC
jgi:hypothetical protein